MLSTKLFSKLFKFCYMSKPYISVKTTISELDCQSAFKDLQPTQALYAYNFARATWNGSKICYFQRSYESPAMLYIILRGFEQGARHSVDAVKEHFNEETLSQLLIYIAAFIDNAGNYKSFGDTKFIPECSQENFRKFFLLTPYWSCHQEEFNNIYGKIEKLIYNAQTPYGMIDFSDKNGTSGYYSKNLHYSDAQKIKEILMKKGIRSENNRLIKHDDTHYTVRIASIEIREEIFVDDGIQIRLQFGEFACFLKEVNHYLQEAKNYSANEVQSKMIDEYIKHFCNGNVQTHIQSQKYWIQDKGPLIQTNIGFIETYLDPLKIRAQFEGFVAVVNQEQSKLLNKLVEGAENTLKYLPWGKNFEGEVFQKPDFTSLQVLAFSSSGVPIGINIPNYDQVRQHYGFKNVTLANAYGKPTPQSIQYTPQEQIQLHLKYANPALFVKVALHQLLGHGSGRLIYEKPNFTSTIDGSEITTYYKQNETWGSVFGKIASTYEECKADSVALYLSLFEDVQQTLLPKFTKQERWDIVYATWHQQIMKGFKGLQYFDIEHQKWLQAHVGGSFAILSVLREAGGIFEVKQIEKDGKLYPVIHLDRDSIQTKGKAAIGKFLTHLQVYKSTADFQRANTYFQKYLHVDELYLKYRDIVLKNKIPRRLLVQPDVRLTEGKVQYIRFEDTSYGLIDSALSHYSENVEEIIEEWQKNNQEFIY